jgi:hypothetical protein
MRNSQPHPHPALRLLPQERGDGDVLDPIDPIGRYALGGLRAIERMAQAAEARAARVRSAIATD